MKREVQTRDDILNFLNEYCEDYKELMMSHVSVLIWNQFIYLSFCWDKFHVTEKFCKSWLLEK